MPELRRDPVTNRWVVLAPARESRPEVLPSRRAAEEWSAADCPFCAGHEAMTPPEVAAVRAGSEPNKPGWQVRVVPNLFPAFSTEDGPADMSNPLWTYGPALGLNEVIIHSPDHDRWLPYLTASDAELIMTTTFARYWRHRVQGVGTVLPLYNHGRDAGASLAHPHGQLYAARLTAPFLDEELVGAEAAHRQLGGCVFCRMVREELQAAERVVAESPEFVAITPWASRAGFETWIIPREHQADLGMAGEDLAASLGVFLRGVLWRIAHELGDVPLNWYIHSHPAAAGDALKSYHWHLEIRPRLQQLAGFELSTGTYINTVAPEAAARALRGMGEPGPEASDPPV
ncbi:MAG TPA: galactose-1-phosphate uridylyltransferase [Candidatus Dormibacteraeota bacterium]|nr:galactose-1-phosphate uridylyltransferase [Candidatus Dormibacteraeota bacterium]